MTEDHKSDPLPMELDPDELEMVPLAEVIAAVDQLDPGDPDWADLQWYVADALHEQYLEGQVNSSLDEAIRRGRRVVAVQNEQSPTHLYDLSTMLWDRFDEKHRDDDLNEYTRLLEAALALLDGEDADEELRAKCQANLATGLMSHNRYEAAEQDLDRAIAYWEAALDSGRLDEDMQAGIAANLAQALSREGASEHDLRRALGYGRQSIQAGTDDLEVMAHSEFAVAAALSSLHSIVNHDGLLGEAIDFVRRGLVHLGPDSQDVPGYTANLIGLLRQQARETGGLEPLAEAVRLARGLVTKTSDGDLDHVLILSTSAAAISDAATQANDRSFFYEALDLYRQAIAIASDSSHEKGVALINLASVCRDSNEWFEEPERLTEGIDGGEQALAIFQEPGLARAAALTATSNCLRDQYSRIGDVATFDLALGYAEEALALTPENHPERAARSTNLAVLLSDDFEERADRATLDRAIALYREALAASERVRVRVPERQNDLALALRDRHKDAGNADDLNEAVDMAECALAGSRPGLLTWAGYANNLGNALAERYELEGNPNDLNRVVELFEQALADAADRVYESSGYATNLGLALATRAQVSGTITDMDQALLSLSRSVDLLPSGHPGRAYRISNLADAYRQRSIMFENGGHTELAQADAVAAVDTAEDAVDVAGTSDARLLPALSNLAEALRWQRDLIPGSIAGARIMEVQRRAATLDQISPSEKFGQAALWARDAEQEEATAEALKAYTLAVTQTTEVAWIGLSVAERLDLLRAMNEVLSRAVVCAARAGKPWMAVAWADHVRSILWRQGVQATTLSALRNDPRFVGLSGLHDEPAGETTVRKRNHREQLRQWAHAEREALRIPIAATDRYQSLIFPGVIVLLVPDEDASCALLLRAHEAPQLVELPCATRDELTARIETLGQASAAFRTGGDGGPSGELRARHAIFDCLEWLWDSVAEPILGEVAPSAEERPQLWWSPVGEFALLPVHAAGKHPRKSGQIVVKEVAVAATVPDRVRSSYLPTVLMPSSAAPRASTGSGALLYVSANDASGSLTTLVKEKAVIRSAMRNIPVKELIEEDATRAALREAIPSCSFLHIAAHGASAADDSFQVGFQLSDGMFTLRDLAGCRADSGALAVLLTCDSATGDTHFPNEALHVAGAAQQAGFPDVIAATMPVRDASSLPVVGAVYQALDSSPGAVSEVVPAALDAVVQTLRLDPGTGTDPLSWVPYAHFRAGFLPRVPDDTNVVGSVVAGT